MRDIKFRAWDKLDNMMHIDPFIHQYDGYLNKDWFRLEYLIFMQYTGLKDKNGKDIYEGDILSYDTDYDYLYFIEWDKNSALFQLKFILDKELCQDAVLFDDLHLDKLSIIGNIYENKELLNA